MFFQSPINKYFNPIYYKKTYNLDIDNKVALYNHYINVGSKLNYNPSIYFNTKWYKNQYNINDVTNPYEHFINNFNKGYKPNEKCKYLIHDGINKLPWINITSEFIPIISEKKRINIVLPGPGLSAGPQTLYGFANILAKKGFNVRIIFMFMPLENKQKCLDEAKDRMEFDDSIELVSHYNNDIVISFDDIFVASAWWTIYPLKYILGYLKETKFFWFIQEMELIFHAGDEIYSRALETYNMDYYSYVHCSTMLEYLRETKFMCFKNEEYIKNNVICFEPTVPTDLFYYEPKNKDKIRIIFYSRDAAPRNLTNLIKDLLCNAIKNRIIDESCEIIAFGGDKKGRFKITDNYYYNDVGFLNITEYSRLLRSSHIAINMVLSPHIGLIPFEMAFCGGMTIHNEYFSKNEESIKHFTDKVLISEPNQVDLMKNLELAIYRTKNNMVSTETPKNIQNNFNVTLDTCYKFMKEKIGHMHQ